MEILISSMGAIPDGITNNTHIIQQAINTCSETGGRVVISGGIYLTGKLMMKSNVDLHISAGSVLLGSPDYSDYPEAENLTCVNTKMLPRERNTCLIFAENCKNISITGMGTIDCNGERFVELIENPQKNMCKYRRIEGPTPPRAVFFTKCENVKIEDVTMTNPPAGWSYWIHNCDFVTFDKVKILANVDYPNNDGIHINCSRNVTVSNCFIVCGDDCIVVRANSASLKENTPCEKVSVTNCTLTSHTNGIRIGWINDGVIRNCVFSNIVITDSRNGISIELPNRIRQSGNVRIFDPNNPISTDVGNEETLITDLLFSNFVMDGIYNYPVFISISDSSNVRCREIRDIHFTNIRAKSLKYPFLKGRKENPLKDIYFNNCSFKFDNSESNEQLSTPTVSFNKEDRLHFINTQFD